MVLLICSFSAYNFWETTRTTTKMITPDIRETIETAIDEADRELWKVNQGVCINSISNDRADSECQLWKTPETLFEEVQASKLLSNWLEARGWTVKWGVHGIDTAFEARFSVKEGRWSNSLL
jgi:hypothetical protein